VAQVKVPEWEAGGTGYGSLSIQIIGVFTRGTRIETKHSLKEPVC